MLQLMNLFKPMARRESQKAMEDPTLYKVMTNVNCIAAMYYLSDNMIIWLKVVDKPVKNRRKILYASHHINNKGY